MQNLSNAKTNVIYVIDGFSDGLPVKIYRRLCDLGLSKGEKVRVESRSLLKKAILIEIRGYMLSLKSSIAAFVRVK